MSAFLCVSLLVSIAAPLPKRLPRDIIELCVFESNIAHGDPLDVLFTFNNPESDSVITKDHITPEWPNTLWFEVKQDGDDNFRKVVLNDYAFSAAHSPKYRFKYPLNSASAQHIFLLRSGKDYILREPGSWQVRSCVDTSDGIIYSKTVSITVSESPKSRIMLLTEHSASITMLNYFRGFARTDTLTALKSIRGEFDDTYLQRKIDDALLIHAFRCARLDTEISDASVAIDTRLAKLSGCAKDLFALDYASALIEMGDVKSSKKILELIVSPLNTESLRTELKKLEEVKR